MSQIKPTSVPNLWVRNDGFISDNGKDGPWTRGLKICVNSDMVRKKGYTPKYYYVVVKNFLFLYVHRLVALAFCENPCEAHFTIVDHISGDSLANESSNLRWLNHQLNSLNQTGTKNCYLMKKWRKWRAYVKISGKTYRWGSFKTYRQAHTSAMAFKAAKFTEIYRNFISNESETTRACQHIFGRPGPTLYGPAVHYPRVCGPGVLRPPELGVRNSLPKAGANEKPQVDVMDIELTSTIR